MDIEPFLFQCNKTPLLKEYIKKAGIITEKLLFQIGFTKKIFEISDLFVLKDILLGFQKPEEPEIIKKVYKAKREAKDLRHQWLIKNFNNQEFVMQLRKKLEMPFENRGFLIKRKEKPKTKLRLDKEIYESYTNMDFNFSPEFESWFFRNSKNKKDYDEWEEISASNWKEVLVVVNKALVKWDLPRRYEGAIRELILFNRIIPAISGIKWSSERKTMDGELEESIVYDADTTKDELKKTIDRDQYGIFKNKRKYLPGKPARAKRNPEETKKTEKMIEFYNSQKNNGATDKKIFEILSYKHDLSVSAIRKRIGGK